MQNEKIENLLNLALEATSREREKSLQLEVGYDVTERTWEVIVKFVGTTEQLNRLLNENFPQDYDHITVTNLQNEYAILILPEQIVEAVASLPQIEYMEKPKRLSFTVDSGKRASCISPLQTGAGQNGNLPAGEVAVNRRNLSGFPVSISPPQHRHITLQKFGPATSLTEFLLHSGQSFSFQHHPGLLQQIFGTHDISHPVQFVSPRIRKNQHRLTRFAGYIDKLLLEKGSHFRVGKYGTQHLFMCTTRNIIIDKHRFILLLRFSPSLLIR